MLLRLLEEKWPLDEVVFYDTGMEFNAIYKIRDQVKSMLGDYGIKFTELKPDYDFKYRMFEEPILRKEEHRCECCKHCTKTDNGYKCSNIDSLHLNKVWPSELSQLKKNVMPWHGGCRRIEPRQYSKFGYSWCGGFCRWGTKDKINTVSNYCKGTIQYVGIAADEEHRFEKEKREGKLLPLVHWGMTEDKCLTYCYDHGFDWVEDGGAGEVSLYYVLDRVSCWCCCNKNLKELKNIYLYMPEYWDRLRDLQAKTERPMKGVGKSVFDLEKRFAKEISEE